MKLKIILFAIVLFAVTFGSAFIEYFQAKSDNGNVKLEWKTNNESNLQEFIVEKKTVHGNFLPIGNIDAKGSNSYYSFTDENVYKNTNDIFVYRLKILDKDNSSTYSKEISVSHSLSDIKRTWGSIKAMFR
jgi:hypothetical protein